MRLPFDRSNAPTPDEVSQLLHEIGHLLYEPGQLATL